MTIGRWRTGERWKSRTPHSSLRGHMANAWSTSAQLANASASRKATCANSVRLNTWSLVKTRRHCTPIASCMCRQCSGATSIGREPAAASRARVSELTSGVTSVTCEWREKRRTVRACTRTIAV